jgi:hypothetical protein
MEKGKHRHGIQANVIFDKESRLIEEAVFSPQLDYTVGRLR